MIKKLWNDKRTKQWMACLLALALVLSPATAMAATTEVMPDKYAMTLHAAEGSAGSLTPGDAIKENATISLNDQFFINIHWEKLENVVAGTSYTLEELPAEIGAPSADGIDTFSTVVNGVPAKFATLSWTAQSRFLTVTFEDLGKLEGMDILHLLENVNIYFACKLDKDELNANNNGEIIITFPGPTEITVTVDELKPLPPKVEKTVSTLSDKGVATWAITYQHPIASYSGGLPAKLSDVLPEGLEYVPGSLTLAVNGTSESPVINAEYENTSRTVLYTLPQDLPAGATVLLTYQTKLPEDTLTSIWAKDKTKYSFTNTVTALDKHDVPIIPTTAASATLDIDDKWSGFNMISKTGTASTVGTSRTIDWIIIVNTGGSHFKTLRLTDLMGKGLILKTDTIEVNGVKHSPLIDGTTKMVFDLVTNGAPNPAAQTYAITYTTEIDPHYFNQNNSDNHITDADLENVASLEYEWPDGTGRPGADRMPPSILKKPKDVGINGSLITKKAIAYNAQNHSMTWEVTLNPNHTNLTRAKMEDTLAPLPNPHLFTPGKDDAAVELANSKTELENAIKNALKSIGLSDSLLTSLSLTNDHFIAELGAIGTNSLTFQFKTYVADPEIWAGNVKEHKFENEVILKSGPDGTLVAGAEIAKDVSAKATQKYTSNVLEKTHTSYDPVTKKLSWTLTVNKNKTSLGNVTITDTLSDLLSCDPADAKLDGNASFGAGNSFTVKDNEITITLSNVTDTHTITFDTTVNVDHPDARKLSSIPIKNTASITSDANKKTTLSNEASLSIDNPVVSKINGTPDAVGRLVSYSVQVNPLGIDLVAAAAIKDLTIKDTLSDGLYLDLESIQLHEAIQTSTKEKDTYKVALTAGAQVNDPITTYNAPENSFSVKIPDATQCYILTYKAYIVRSGVPLSNKVELTGSILPENATNNEATKSFTLVAFGNANFRLPSTKFFSIEIKKTATDGKILKGATFGLYSSKSDSSLLATATCDDTSGIATLAVPKSQLGKATKLYWKEIKAPDNYLLNDQWHEVDVATDNQAILSMVNLPLSDKGTAEISIQKENELGAPLSGAHFALYTDEACTIKQVDATAVDDQGKLTFTNLDPTRTYWVKETISPVGYSLLTQPIGIEAKTTAVITTITNQLANAQLAIKKTNKAGGTLAGAHFALYNHDKTVKLAEGITANDGSLVFPNLDQGTVHLQETRAPFGYLITQEWTAVTLKLNETTSVTIENRVNSGGGTIDPPPPDPSDPPTDPSDPPTDPSVPPTDPSVPPTDPSVPPTDPSVPPTDPVVPPTDRPNLPQTGVTDVWFWLSGLVLALLGCACVIFIARTPKRTTHKRK